jgi:hypothetical protein
MTDTPAQEPIAWRYRLKGAKQRWIYDDTIKNADDPRVVDKTYYEVEPLYAAVPADGPRSDLEPYFDAALRHADGLNAQLQSPNWTPRRAHIEQARNTIRNLIEKVRSRTPAGKEIQHLIEIWEALGSVQKGAIEDASWPLRDCLEKLAVSSTERSDGR